MSAEDDFREANEAFNLFTLDERKQALERFAELRYPSIADRFFEAVYQVITRARKAAR
jgi:hypothetical protein